MTGVRAGARHDARLTIAGSLAALAALSIAACGGSPGAAGEATPSRPTTATPAIPFTGPSLWLSTVAGLQRISADGTQQAALKDVAGSRVVVGDGAVWVLARTGDSLLKVDPATNTVAATVDLSAAHGQRESSATSSPALEAGLGSIWVFASGATKLVKVDPASAKVAAAYELGKGCDVTDLAVAGKSVFLAMRACASKPQPSVYRFDPVAGKLGKPVEAEVWRLAGSSDALLTASQGVYGAGAGYVFDPEAGVAVKRLSGTPRDVAIGQHTVWWPLDNQISVFSFTDPRGVSPGKYPDLKGVRFIRLSGVTALAAAGKNMWAAGEKSTLWPVDQATGAIGSPVTTQVAVTGVQPGQMAFG